jgi:hypothetical protein
MVGELGGLSSLLWVNTAYILTGTVAMPAYGCWATDSAGGGLRGGHGHLPGRDR